jgi:hypothetical protein
MTSKLPGDLSRDGIRKILSPLRWRAISIVAVDDTWSALRIRPMTPAEKSSAVSDQV